MAQPPEGTPDSAGSRNLKLDVDEMGAHFFSAAEQERSLFEAKKKSYLRSFAFILLMRLIKPCMPCVVELKFNFQKKGNIQSSD